MKKRCFKNVKSLFCVFAVLTCISMINAEELKSKKKMIVSTTIDFLDYVYRDGGKTRAEAYPLERYEEKLAQIAATGIKKIYIRVNALGFTLYPTKVSAIFGTHGGYHWNLPPGNKSVQNLISTIKLYDPLKETIRVGHKLGMEVWCWESLYDGSGYKAKTNPELQKKYGKYPFVEPFYRKHHEYFAEIDPRKTDMGFAIKGETIGKIVFNSFISTRHCRIDKSNLIIYVSDDNKTYKKYTKPFKVRITKDSKKRNILTISGLHIKEQYVRLGTETKFDDKYSLAIGERRGANKVYNTKGKLLASCWQWTSSPEKPLDYAKPMPPASWDYSTRQVGFVLGEPKVKREQYYMGVYEYTIPEVRKHQWARFKELAAYDFDGYMFNLRSHSSVADPEFYGYNKPVRDKFLKLYGKDIYKDKYDRKKLLNMRADSVDTFLDGCKKMLNGRPLYISGVKPGSPRQAFYTGIPWHYKKWFKNGTIDGVIMLRAYFPEYFTNEITGGKAIKLGTLKEMLYNNKFLRNPKVSLEKLQQDKVIDEVELYESIAINENKKLRKGITEFIKQQEK